MVYIFHKIFEIYFIKAKNIENVNKFLSNLEEKLKKASGFLVNIEENKKLFR